MIEIQPATDEEIARIERIVSGQVYSGRNNEYILSLIARIRAEQAKQGEVERDLTMAIAVELRRLNRDGEIDIMEAARCLGTVAKRYTLATPANSRAEAIRECIAIVEARAKEYEALIGQGKGEHGKPGYVKDTTWDRWQGHHSEALMLFDALRALLDKEGE